MNQPKANVKEERKESIDGVCTIGGARALRRVFALLTVSVGRFGVSSKLYLNTQTVSRQQEAMLRIRLGGQFCWKLQA